MREHKQQVTQLVEEFANAVIGQDAAATADEGNKHAKRYIQIFRAIVENYGDAGREALTPLLRHLHPRVRSVVASFLLRYAHDDAIAVLRELASGTGMPAFRAQCSLKNWEDGTWELDPE